jgi:TRAP-type C4-dicarboxylate transport system permease small subunit
MKLLRTISNICFSLERILAVLLFAFMTTSILLGVIFRYFLSHPLKWSDEFAMFALVWITFIGGSMSIKLKKAAVMSFVMDRLSPKVSRVFIAIGTLLVLLFSAFILYLSLKWITNPHILLQRSQAVGVPMVIPYVAIPLGFLFMSIHALELFADSFRQGQQEGGA